MWIIVCLKDERYRLQKIKLPELERELAMAKQKMIKLNQETGIVKNKYLKNDFIQRKKNIDALKDEKDSIEVR